MARRLEFGATDEAVELCAIARLGDVRGVGRIRAQRLADAGYNDLTKLLEADVNDIVDTVDSTLRAELMRRAVVDYLELPNRHSCIDHTNRAARLGRDARLVKQFYDTLGIPFETAAVNLLKTIFPNIRKQDDGGNADPDLAIPLTMGLLVIECKTKGGDAGTINLHDAFAVHAKSAHLAPVGMVTLGKPAFDAIPIERAAKAAVCLVTGATLCEAVIRIWEGKMTAEALVALLIRPGYLERVDFDHVVK